MGRLTLKNEMLKKLRDLDTKEKRVFISSNLKRLGSAQRGCKIMGIPRSKYYYRPKGKKPPDMELSQKIGEIALQFPSYGYRRITAQLCLEGLNINHKRVLRIMRDKNLLCRARKAYKATTDSSHGLIRYPNLIENLIPYRTDQLWHADIIYIRIAASFVYLAAIIDGFSKKIIGYGLGTLSADLP